MREEGCGFDAVDSVKDYEELGERSASYFERASEDSEAERKVQGAVQQNPGVRGALDEILPGLGGAGPLREEDRKRQRIAEGCEGQGSGKVQQARGVREASWSVDRYVWLLIFASRNKR